MKHFQCGSGLILFAIFLSSSSANAFNVVTAEKNSQLENKVEENISNDLELNPSDNVVVTADGGVVELEGVVEGWKDADQIVDDAFNNGAKKVISRLRVRNDLAGSSGTRNYDVKPTLLSRLTAHELIQDSSKLRGKQVQLYGKIDRILPNGVYLVADEKKGRLSGDEILVFTQPQSKAIQSKRLQMHPLLKEGDLVKINGKLEKSNVSGLSAQSVPVLVTQSWDISRG